MKLFKLALILFANICIFLVLVLAVELGSIFVYDQVYKKDDPMFILKWSRYYWNYYERDMRSHRENLILEHSKEMPGKFKSTYITTPTGKRYTPPLYEKVERDIIFYGCSFTYGEGVNNNQTIAYHVQEALPNTHAHNLGLSGYGPNEALDSVLNMDEIFREDPPLKKPIGIYIYFKDHISRTTFNISHMYWTDILSLRTFTYNEDGSLKEAVFYREKHPIKYFLYSLVKVSRFTRILYLELVEKAQRAPSFNPKDIQDTMKIIKLTQDKFLERYPDGDFYVFTLDPDGESQNTYMRKFGINILNDNDKGFDGPRLPDGHFSSIGNKMLADKIIELLKNRATL
jgi:hypothetical protein